MLERRGSMQPTTATLADILDKVLDKGLVVAGDIRISLANVELLTIQVRLLVCSIDKAEEIGLDWWRRDRFLSSGASQEHETNAALQARVEALERQLADVLPSSSMLTDASQSEEAVSAEPTDTESNGRAGSETNLLHDETDSGHRGTEPETR